MKKLILILTFCISCAQTDETIITPTEINYTIEKIHETDYVPWSIEFIDENTFLYTEREVKCLKFTMVNQLKLKIYPMFLKNQGGLLDIELHPNFSVK